MPFGKDRKNMEKTDTKSSFENTDFHQEEITTIADVLCNGGIALLPTDTVWSTVVLLNQEKGLGKMVHYLGSVAQHTFPELLVRDHLEAKKYLTHLHPRLETLWTFHSRPLSILFDNPVNLPGDLLYPNGSIAIRVATDPFLKEVIEKCGMPLMVLPATTANGALALNFEQVSRDLVAEMDYTAAYRRWETAEGELSVMVRFDSSEELEFLRE